MSRDDDRRSRRRSGAPRPTASATPPEGLACGFHAVRMVLSESPGRVEKILLARGQHDQRTRRLVAMAREAGVAFQQVPSEALERLAAGVQHQGMVAKLAGKALLEASDLIAALGEEALVVLVDGVEDPRNLGAIIRSAAALGVDGMFLPRNRTTGLSPAASKTAAGGLELLPVARAGNSGQLLDRLADRDFEVAALDPDGDRTLWEAEFGRKTVIVVGGEAKGVRSSLRERCTQRIRIPIHPAVGSLNVSVAVGILLAEYRRQCPDLRARRA